MNSLKKYRVIIAVLSVLLAVVLTLLAVQIARKMLFQSNKVTVGDNVIGSSEQNWVFGAEGMLPGDSVCKTYSIVITQKEDMEMDVSVEVT